MAFAQPIHILLPEFQAFLVLISRIGGLLAAVPVLSGRAVPLKVKVALILSLGLLLAPMLHLPSTPYDPLALAAGLVSEMTIGLAIGLAVRKPRAPAQRRAFFLSVAPYTVTLPSPMCGVALTQP